MSILLASFGLLCAAFKQFFGGPELHLGTLKTKKATFRDHAFSVGKTTYFVGLGGQRWARMGARSGLWGPFGRLGRLAGGVWGVIGDFWVVLGGVAAVFGGFEAVLGRLGADCVRLVGEDEAKVRHAGGMLGACWARRGLIWGPR